MSKPGGQASPSPFVVKQCAFQMHIPLRVYRIITDFAKCGDVHDFVRNLTILKSETGSYKKIRCAFTWKFFDALIKTVIHMHAHDNFPLRSETRERILHEGER
jgi:hypothetical protein